ncbi:DUF3649 domain-containing protein [Solimonas sp. K1W22B-7]|uniref:DUF3649 domain-containing protein n=1 Tax=Solimonas sp. K1W22B-7 TaxID=2303331 RepID=UPI000E334B23|nr:DUF3649 domain-containing protein [Solimonas sp. K1W22B-7]AXQ29354.1 DUF3649 domain-containing protein [Solimonas sp. K1W22B-7]
MTGRAARRGGWREAAGVLSRLIAALLGGYALSAALAAVLALHLPLERSEAVLVGTMLSFLVYVLAVMWAFAARHALRAWSGLLAPLLILALVLAAPGGTEWP